MKPYAGSPPGLRVRLTVAFFALFVTSLLITALVVKLVSQRALDTTRASATQLIASTQAPAAGDPDELGRWIEALGNHPSFAAVTIRDTDGNPLDTRQRRQETGDWLTRLLADETAWRLSLPLAAGSVEVELARAPVRDAARHALLGAVAATAGLLLVTAFFARSLLARFAAPLKPLALWLRHFARGNNWRQQPPELDCSYREVRELYQAAVEGSESMRHHLRSLEETRELLDHSEDRLRALVDGMQEALFELDPRGRLRFLNPAWERLTGFTSAESLGRPFGDFLNDEDSRRQFEPQRLAALGARGREIALRHASGRQVWASLHVEPRLDAQGRVNGVVGTLGDATERIELNRLLTRYQAELYQLSVTDALTGLFNRRHFDTQLEIILAEHLPRNQPVCLLLVDLDGFKFINDTYGHPFGDEVLRAMSQVLRSHVRRNDYVARMAGDEFAMVLKNTNLAAAAAIARKLHARISETRVPMPVGTMQLQTSIGLAEAPTHGTNAGELVSAADVALYHSKRGGRNRVEVLSPDMSKAVMSLFHQGFRLRRALDQGHLYPAFQPIYDLSTGRAVAVEVLARMRLDDDLIHAKDFIAIAEELGLTRDLDLHIIGRALALTAPEQALFLNVDLSSFADREFVEQLRRLLEPACRAGRRITIEITERETVPISDALIADIHGLRTLGCKLALDDFGSGYSTYNFLNQFRPDYLKIEGSFVRGMLESEAARKIVAHIHELAQSFGMETIAECVETEAVSAELKRIGIRNVQGWLYGAPALAA
jgi:diguanylate cyclase (GGDEF)-like protein/PAS domain S-box-containing protein